MRRACIRFLPSVVLAVAVLPVTVPAAIPLRAQAQEPLPRFEVASVKPKSTVDWRSCGPSDLSARASTNS